jgi:hypothetical protein
MDNNFELLRRVVTLEVQLADLTCKMEELLAKPPEAGTAWPWARLGYPGQKEGDWLRQAVEDGHIVATTIGTQKYSRGSNVSRETPKGMNGPAGGLND